MLKISHNNTIYNIDKDKLLLLLSHLLKRKVEEDEIEKVLKEYGLYDEVFLKNVDKVVS